MWQRTRDTGSFKEDSMRFNHVFILSALLLSGCGHSLGTGADSALLGNVSQPRSVIIKGFAGQARHGNSSWQLGEECGLVREHTVTVLRGYTPTRFQITGHDGGLPYGNVCPVNAIVD